METAIARIRLKATEEGGKRSPVGLGGDFGCPVFFRDVEALSEHGYDCRLLLQRVGKTIAPGDTAENIPLAFLSPEEVFPHLRIGVRFQLWEAGEIGEGEITEIPG
ncbi:MAG: hypothetical protein KQH63_09560 [Desulfobulbaceae bacterium]|nr:hypothetical protein [Desulfobulbaceae bacterium]